MHDIHFNAEDHSYWIGDVRLESVTTLIKSLCPPFDREAISAKCAKREGITQEAMLAEWERKAEEARDRGTMVHSYVEDVLDDKNDLLLSEMNVKLPEMRAFDGAWKAFRERLNAKVCRKEFVVGCPVLKVAGRVDIALRVTPSSGQCVSLFDWKTGKFERENRFQRLLSPFADLDDCELVKYSLQLSLYRLLIERMETDAIMGDSYLVHLKRDGSFFIYRAIDYRERLATWLSMRKIETEG